ncbi:MAG: FKBP-type peptidyl-prolyl cis-trans isomerase [Planctomycetota bacterium]
MKWTVSLVMAAAVLVSSMAYAADSATGKTAPAAPEMKTLDQKFSYVVGMNMGGSLKSLGVKIDVGALMRGLADGLSGRKPALTEAEATGVMSDVRERIMQRAKEDVEKGKDVGKKNLEAGAAFLAANAKRKGVTTTKSGLQYVVIKEGAGPKPTANDAVRVHYRGTLIDGTEFDSSYKRGKPATFPVGGVIPGWTEALQLMNVGAKCRLFIPGELAYGARGAGPTIGPNAVLIFEVELLGIGDAPEKDPSGRR